MSQSQTEKGIVKKIRQQGTIRHASLFCKNFLREKKKKLWEKIKIIPKKYALISEHPIKHDLKSAGCMLNQSGKII